MTDIATAAAVTFDTFGLTHAGRVRTTNEDHFLIAAVSKSVDVDHTSLGPEAIAHRFGSARASLLAVADGVGGRPEGDVASERTVASILGYVGQTAALFQELNATREHELLGKLEETVRGVHDGLLKEYRGSVAQVPATTLTLVLLVWPRAYLVHVGDLQRLTTDQTLGEYMEALGAWTAEQAAKAKSASALSSTVGGSEIAPVVGLVDLEPGDSMLLCTDGLTKHVRDDRIEAALALPHDAATVARQLVDAALDEGGTDNVTVVVLKTDAA